MTQKLEVWHGPGGEIDKMKSSAETKTRKMLQKTESSSAAHFLLVKLPFFTLASSWAADQAQLGAF